MFKKILTFFLTAVIAAGMLCVPASAVDSASLSDVYWDSANETVYFTLKFSGSTDSAWIGIVPAGTQKDEKSADKVDIKYKYLSSIKSGQKDSLTAKGLKAGKYELHVYANDNGGKYLCGTSFSVGKKNSDGKLSGIAVALDKGDKIKLSALIEPSDASVKWSSSNEKIASVSDSGKVTAKGKGTATITAKSGNSSTTIKIIVE